jgi:predicted nucleotidyltransferase
MPSEALRAVLGELQVLLRGLYEERLAALILYGSQARQSADADSDIDVMVVLNGTVDPGREIGRTGAPIAALSLKYDVVLSCLFVSSERFQNEHSPLLLNVRAEGIRL